MDQFSSQLANNLENGYTAGVPEHLIQIYKELSSWCELIQYKIDVDINTQDDIRKQVLSNNLLKHIQGLWQQKVNEFYSIKRDEARDNLSKAFQNRINNYQRVTDEINDNTEEDTHYQNVYAMPTNEEYFNDNDSLSSEEDYYHNINDMPIEPSATDNNTIDDQSKMVVVVKYNAAPGMNDIVDSFEDEYECDYGNDNYDYDEYDDYDLHHYKEANVTKVSINYTTKEESDAILNNYRDSNDYVEFYERPATPSLPDWPSCYKEINPNENNEPLINNDNACAADFLSYNTWESVNEYYNSFNNNNINNNINDRLNERYGIENENNYLTYTEQIMKEKMAKEEVQENEHLTYTEQIMKEKIAKEEPHENEHFNYTEQLMKEKIAKEEAYENKHLNYTEQIMKEKMAKEEAQENEQLSYTEQIMKEQKRLSYVSFGSLDLEEDNASICSIKNYGNHLELDDHDDIINHLTDEFASMSIKNEDEFEHSRKYQHEHEHEHDFKVDNELQVEDEKEDTNNSKRRLSIIINDSVINGNSMNLNTDNETEKYDDNNYNEMRYKEHLYPRTVKSRDLYYDEYGQDSPSADSVISPNEELFSSTSEEEICEYSSRKVLMTPLSSSALSYTDMTYASDEDSPKEVVSDEDSPKEVEQESMDNEIIKLNGKSEPSIEGNDVLEKMIQEKDENFAKYLYNRRDSGFSETCDEPFIINAKN